MFNQQLYDRVKEYQIRKYLVSEWLTNNLNEDVSNFILNFVKTLTLTRTFNAPSAEKMFNNCKIIDKKIIYINKKGIVFEGNSDKLDHKRLQFINTIIGKNDIIYKYWYDDRNYVKVNKQKSLITHIYPLTPVSGKYESYNVKFKCY